MSFGFHHRVLGNGLTIVAEVDQSSHTSAAGFFVKTGARDESTALMGVSHFLEHMMFKGAEGLSAEQLNREFDSMGARNNAYTSNEMTCFYAQVLPERLPKALDLLGRMMRPSLREEDFTTEKNVILEEIAMYRDNPFWVLYEAAIEKHYGTHPMSHRVLGTDETIKALRRDQMKEYFDTRYSADNTVVALGGRLDFEASVDQIERLCGAWPKTGATRSPKGPEVVGGRLSLKDAKVNRGYYLALCKAPAMEDELRYPAALLAQVLGSPDNSRLHWALVESGVAEEAQSAFDAHDGVGEYYVFAAGDPARLPQIAETIDRELSKLVASVTKEDLERLKSRIATAACLNAERPGDRMQRLGRLWTYLGEYTTLDEELDRINAVSLDDLRRVAEAYPIAPCTVGTLEPALA